MDIVRRGERVNRPAGVESLLAQGCRLAALFGVENEDTVGKGGDARVAACGGGRGWTADAVGEGGEEQEAGGRGGSNALCLFHLVI